MEFKIMLLGKGMAKNENGFSGEGDWDLYKCFYEKDGKYAEFFINLNHAEASGEIKSKDISYASTLEGAFGREMSHLE